MSTEEAHKILVNFQRWRTGEDERTYDEAGIVARKVTQAIDVAISKLTEEDLR